MPIAELWGEAGPLPEGGIVVHDDREARAAVEGARVDGQPPPPLGLLGGDLARTLGAPGDLARLRSPEARRFLVDLLEVTLDGRSHWCVAHAVLRAPWWHGPFLVAMNAQWLGSWDLGPRAHPGDGLVDVTRGELPLNQRLAARRRLPSGAHLPHPALRTSRSSELEHRFERRRTAWLDGDRVGRVRHVRLRVHPGALLVVI